MGELLKKIVSSDWYQKLIYKPYESRSYKSTKEMLKSLDRSNGFLYDIYFTIKCKVSRIWDWPGDRLRDLKHYHQRGIHGVSDCDCWGLYDYLIDVKLIGLKYIKKHKQGCPIIDGYGDHEQSPEQFEAMSKEWDRIVDEMIWTFETVKKTSGHQLIAPPLCSPYFTEEDVKKWQKFCDEMKADYPEEDYRVLTKEEFDRYNRGWEYYKQYFMSLWD